jgi:hydrogenase-4 component E
MTGYADFILLLILFFDIYIVASSRLASCVRASALQGVALALLPVALWARTFDAWTLHIMVIGAGTLAVKGLLIPALLLRAIREADVRREVEPFISLHLSILFAAVLVVISFGLARVLVLPMAPPASLLVPVAFGTLLVGFLVLVSRRKAVTQVVGYLTLENGVFIFGQTLVEQIPFAVELGILLDLLVAVFVMGIAIHHISREFDDIDAELLSALRDE